MASNTIYNNSVFSQYFDSNDPEVLGWVDNVLDKLYQKGIIAKYISRNEGGDDTDYIAYWTSVAKFFAYLVKLAREFENFKSDDYLANQYLLNKGHFTSGNENLDQLAYLISNSLRRRGERGTINSIKKVGNLVSTPTRPNGEILDLVCWDYFTFFKFGVSQSKNNGWNVGNSSPLNRGCTGRYDLNIGYEYTEDVDDLNVYPILNQNYVFLSTYRGKQCIEIEGTPFGQVAGIGNTDQNFEIVVDPRLDYEITFYVAQDATFENLTFGCKAFDIVGNQINLQNIVTGANSNFFFETRRLNKAGTFYMIRGILYNKNKELLADGTLNIGFGHNLRMTEDMVSIIPYIVMDNNVSDDSDTQQDDFSSGSLDTDPGAMGTDDSGSWTDAPYDGQGSIFLWNVKVTPLATEYSRCYLNNKNFIDVFLVNKNGGYTQDQINDILRKYFIPYNTAFKVTYLESISAIAPTENNLLLEDGEDLLLEDGETITLE